MRLVCWNLHGGVGQDGIRDIDRQLEALADLKPDVICLQEVHQRLPWSQYVDIPTSVTQKLNFCVTFAYTQSFFRGHYGNVVATRERALTHHIVKLPNSRERLTAGLWFEGRNALLVDCGGVTVGVTHWSLAESDRLKAGQLLGNFYRNIEGPMVLVGDFNSTADSRAFVELERISGMVRRGVSAPTFPSVNPRICMDYVLSSFDMEVSVGSVEMGYLSDHLPLICDW